MTFASGAASKQDGTQTDRQTDERTDRRADRQTDGQTNKHVFKCQANNAGPLSKETDQATSELNLITVHHVVGQGDIRF